MSALALGGFAIAATADGQVSIGGMTVPAWMASDLALRIAEAAGDVPAAMERRREVRLHLDRMFASARLVGVREMRPGAHPYKALAYREGRRAHVRIGDAVTAWMRHDAGSKRARGMLVEWHHDALYGFVCTTVDGWPRVSMAWRSVERLHDALEGE